MRDIFKGVRIPAGVAILAILSFSGAGCAPTATFPGEALPQALENIAKDLYHIDAVARVSGKTVGVMVYSDQLVDESGQALAENTQELIGNLMLSVTRVSLSTDREVDFVVVALRERDRPLELRLTRYLVDVKMAQTEAIPITESINRTVWESKQYTKESADESEFALKEIFLEDFMIEQIVQRIRHSKDASEETKPSESESESPESVLPERLVEGKFRTVMRHLKERRVFEFSILAFENFKSQDHILDVFKEVRHVFKAYKFKEYDELLIRNLLGRTYLLIDQEDMEQYNQGRINDDDLLKRVTRKPPKG